MKTILTTLIAILCVMTIQHYSKEMGNNLDPNCKNLTTPTKSIITSL